MAPELNLFFSRQLLQIYQQKPSKQLRNSKTSSHGNIFGTGISAANFYYYSF